jgi:hypothetical protein
MKSKIIIIALLCLFSTATFACDICGCFMGITPYDSQSSFGLLYRYRSFSGFKGQPHYAFPNGSSFFFPNDDRTAPKTHHGNDPSDYELYRTMELKGRYFVHKRLELNTIIPYNGNTQRSNGYTSTISGLGDINIYAGYHLIRQLDQKTFNHRLIVGAGVKLPTGKTTIESTSGDRYSTLLQPGTGSTDGFVYANYLLGYKKFGLSLNSSYKVNGENNLQQGVANSTTSFLNLFYTQKLSNNWQVIPQAQFFYEYSKGETKNGVATGHHEMDNLMSGIGVDLFYKNIALNVGYQTSLYSGELNHTQSTAKLYVGVTYNINQRGYLLK